MHMQGAPATMQLAPYYRDVTKDVVQFLAQRVQYARAGESTYAHCGRSGVRIGKTDAHNSRFCRNYPNSDVCKFLLWWAVAQIDVGRASAARGR